ncbi:6-phosphogluconolactonase [Desulfovibrio ferrophilus]|uniref:6-phosphogluconolactonase n=1 Tax=Desulfovibrio ferrophilus TaxID=241368 RepID=A0A2Z6AXI1_9BACT|nr:6-phosphogluconolactonase [Desulfovibrio ferrophilus]BBD07856.1 6-phosphogluconolactonase [Desulfovibrio ferrophilus]
MNIIEFDDMESMSAHAADMAREIAVAAVAERGAFTLALSGGSTPRQTYEMLADAGDIPWDKGHIFFSDERCVKPDHEHSNYRMANEALLSKIDIPPLQVHRIKAAGFTPGLDAGGYEVEVFNTFKFNKLDEDGECPFDLMFLGMGEDGHTASLFPGGDSMLARRQLVMAIDPVGYPKLRRISMTLPLINMARNVVIMISGAKKRALLSKIERDLEAAQGRYPVALVEPRGTLTWLAAK